MLLTFTYLAPEKADILGAPLNPGSPFALISKPYE